MGDDRARLVTWLRRVALAAAALTLYGVSAALWLPFLWPPLVQGENSRIAAVFATLYARVPPLALVPVALGGAGGGVALAARLRAGAANGGRAPRWANAIVGLGVLVCIATVFYALIVLALSGLQLAPAG